MRASNWWTRSIQLGASCLKRSFAALSCSLCMPSLMVCFPSTSVFSGPWEPFSAISMAEYYLTTKKRRVVKAQGPLSRTDDPSSQYRSIAGRKSKGERTYVLLILENYINNLNGTDGHRPRCRQFYTSSNYPPLHFLASSRSSLQRSRYPLSLRHSGVLGQETSPMVYQNANGLLCLQGFIIMNPIAQSRKITRSHAKPSAG